MLPPLLVLPGEEWESPLVGLLAEEIVKDDPGQEAGLDRLLDPVCEPGTPSQDVAEADRKSLRRMPRCRGSPSKAI